MFGKLKYYVASQVKQNPYLWYYTGKYVNRFSFFLPHERDYWGLRWILKGSENGEIIDVGANTGISALGFNRVVPNRRIVSFEIDSIFENDLKKVKDRLKNFEFNIVGLGETKASVEVYKAFYNHIPLHALTSLNREYIEKAIKRDFSKRAEKIRINSCKFNITSLDSFNFHPEFIKIDIEGYELAALKGMAKTLVRSSPTILIEYTPVTWSENAAFLREFGYEFFWYDRSIDRFYRVSDEFFMQLKTKHGTESLQINIYCVHSSKHQVIESMPIAN